MTTTTIGIERLDWGVAVAQRRPGERNVAEPGSGLLFGCAESLEVPHCSRESVGRGAGCGPVTGASLCVLASSSGGNCSALLVERGDEREVVLIDAGLSPRRTRAFLAMRGWGGVRIAGIVLTHLDHDHWNPSWLNALDEKAPVWVHRRHLGRAGRSGVTTRRTEVFEEQFEVGAGVEVKSSLLSHDSLGCAVFRFCVRGEERSGTLGYATDLGRATEKLVRLLKGVETLAIESNYCPVMQEASNRPEFLKRRITDGSGHLSNEQSAHAVAEIGPTRRVVLLHLSRECNRPEVAAAEHAARYGGVVEGVEGPGTGVRIHVSRPDGPIEPVDLLRA